MFKKSLLVAQLLILSACSVPGDPQNPQFPDPYTTVMDGQRGTYPNLQDVHSLGPGMTKDQLYQLFGHPHYQEGFFRVRQWDYLFHFKTAAGLRTCQLKVLFDDNLRTGSFHWRAVEPAGSDCPPPLPEVQPPAPGVERTNLSADALFNFDRSDLNAAGRATLAGLVEKLKGQANVRAIDIVGHSDRLGADDYNQRLSEARARTVQDYLQHQGLPVRSAKGVGKAEPLVQCAEQSRPELIRCLQPNRRVTIDVDTGATAAAPASDIDRKN